MGKRYLKVAAVYFTIGVLLGFVMGIAQDFRLASVHAHINLLGWVSMALFGIIYHFYPNAAETKVAKTQFWLHNIGIPVMQGGIAFEILTGITAVLPLIIVGSILVVVSVLLFTINVFKYVNKTSSKEVNNNLSV
ncbi:cytochrome-c oxidase [Bacillus sp. 03113]|uniref:cytochrome-c oxidase n=1 Tax=Bacillus sp. 03113 TaxID=2578211 RepID=UPI00114393A7|nr:cytochrome-c oxidase [Bacillus sp. 03113]